MALAREAMQEAIRTELLAVTGVENVYLHTLSLADEADIIERAVNADRRFVQTWVIRRVSSIPDATRGRVPIGCQVNWIHTFQIELFVAFLLGEGNVEQSRPAEAESDTFMQNIIDSVLEAFQTKRTFGVAFGSQQPLALQNIDPVTIAGMAGFAATFTLSLEEHQTGLTFT